MRAIKRIVELLASEPKHTQYAMSLAPGSTVAIASVKIAVLQDIKVEQMDGQHIVCDDGKTYSAAGHHDASFATARFIVEPHELSREQVISKMLRKELEEFHWKDLTCEQLDAVLKYAKDKREFSPKVRR